MENGCRRLPGDGHQERHAYRRDVQQVVEAAEIGLRQQIDRARILQISVDKPARDSPRSTAGAMLGAA